MCSSPEIRNLYNLKTVSTVLLCCRVYASISVVGEDCGANPRCYKIGADLRIVSDSDIISKYSLDFKQKIGQRLFVVHFYKLSES